jgi:serine/threonine-protein kinase PknK
MSPGGTVDLGIEGIGEATKVGEGGFGIVYRARQDAFGRTVAVKVLSVPAVDDESRRRFDKECRAMGSVSGHPYIAAVYDSGRTRADHLVMEYLVGGSLAQLLRDDGSLPWEEVVDVGVKLAGALATAHAAGVLS